MAFRHNANEHNCRKRMTLIQKPPHSLINFPLEKISTKLHMSKTIQQTMNISGLRPLIPH